MSDGLRATVYIFSDEVIVGLFQDTFFIGTTKFVYVMLQLMNTWVSALTEISVSILTAEIELASSYYIQSLIHLPR